MLLEIDLPENADDIGIVDFLSMIFHDHMGRPALFKPEKQSEDLGLLQTPSGNTIGKVIIKEKDLAACKLKLEATYIGKIGYLICRHMDLESGGEENTYIFNNEAIFCYP